MRVVKVALLGYGTGGAVFHAPFIAAVPRLALSAIVTSRSADVARDVPNAAVVGDAQFIFDDPAIELVVITTPNIMHFDLAERALRAGKHVVIDKPMTTTSTQADQLIALAARCGKLLSVYQNRRWDGDFLTVRKCIDDGRCGTVYSYEAHYDRFRPAIKAGWRERPLPASGLLFDLGSHLIDQVLELFGLPQTLSADVIVQRPQAQVDDYFVVTMQYANRRAIVGASTLVARPGPHFAVHGDRGSFVKYGMDPQEADLKAGKAVASAGWGVDEPAAYGTFSGADGASERIPTIPGSYARYYEAIADAIVDGAPLPVTAQQARDVVRTIELARVSALERRTVAVT